MKKLRIWWRHLTNTNKGYPEVFYGEDDKMMVGFRCDDCGELHDASEVPKHITHPELYKHLYKG